MDVTFLDWKTLLLAYLQIKVKSTMGSSRDFHQADYSAVLTDDVRQYFAGEVGIEPYSPQAVTATHIHKVFIRAMLPTDFYLGEIYDRFSITGSSDVDEIFRDKFSIEACDSRSWHPTPTSVSFQIDLQVLEYP